MENLTTEKIKYYREHPEEFVEECFDIKLLPFQKEMIQKYNNENYITRYTSYNKTFWNTLMALAQSDRRNT